MAITLILGGARSGKSSFAEARLQAATHDACYIATARTGLDEAMDTRIVAHQHQRPAHWRTIEAPIALPQALGECPQIVLVDCLTLWLSNLMIECPQTLSASVEHLEQALIERNRAGLATYLVSNEVGFSLVPETSIGRQFRDRQGRLNQRIATLANEVYLVCAGLPLTLKHASTTPSSKTNP